MRRYLVAIGLLTVLLLAAPAPAGTYEAPPWDIHPVWSPDGSVIVYFRGGPTGPSDGGLRVVSPDGTKDRRLVVRPFDITGQFVFSPDWRWIAFVDAVEGGSELRVVHPDGSGRHVVAKGVAD